MEVMLRTNYPEDYEQNFNDESAYWMIALRFVEETSSEMEEWRIAQRYALACIYYATNDVSTPYYVENFMNENETSVLEWDAAVSWADRASTVRQCDWSGVVCTGRFDTTGSIDNILNRDSPLISIAFEEGLPLLTGRYPIAIVIY